MRNSTILFIVALLILGWFGAEVFSAQEICASSCVSLSGLSLWEQVVAVAVLPVLLGIGAFSARKKEKITSSHQ